MEKISNSSLNRSTFIETTSRVSFIALCILLIDCAISGGGHWFWIGTLSFRMIFGLIAALCALPSIFIRLRTWIKNPVIISFVLFIFYLAISAYIGISKGNRTDVIGSDLAGFAWLFIIPVAMAVITTRKRIDTVVKCVIIGAVVQALMVIVINLFSLFNHDYAQPMFDKFMEMQMGFAEPITQNLFRIFTKSSPFMIMGIIGLFYLQTRSERFNWAYIIMSGLCLNALLITFTRSIYGSAFIALILTIILFLVFCKESRKKLVMHIIFVSIATVVFVLAQQFASGENYIKFAVSRALSIDVVSEEQIDAGEVTESELNRQKYIMVTADSDDLRKDTRQELVAMIKQSPVFGNGLGAAIDCRENGLVEYFYHDLINKMGILGLVIYFFPIGYLLIFSFVKWRELEKDHKLQSILFFCGLSAFLFASYYNPYMNAVLGISCYAICISGIVMNRTLNLGIISGLVKKGAGYKQANEFSGTGIDRSGAEIPENFE